MAAGLVLVLHGPAMAQPPPSPGPTPPSPPSDAHADLAAQANNPNAPLLQAAVEYGYVAEVKGAEGYSSEILFLVGGPVSRSRVLPFPQITRLEIPVATTPNPGRTTGLGDVGLFHTGVAALNRSLSLGFGYALVFPTATSEQTGGGKWQLGPALVLIYTGVRHLAVGALIQNPISIGGDSTRAAVNQLQVTPTLTYSLRGGWFVGLGDFNWTLDWEAGTTLIPLVLQFGKVTKIGKQGVSLSAEVGPWVVHPDPPYPVWGVRVSVGFLFPGVVIGKRKH